MPLFGIILATLSSFLATLAVFTCCACLILCSRGGIQLGDGLPGAFDDAEEFQKEEEQALELMNDESRQSYLMAKRWIEQNPPNSASSDISLSQYLTIQEKAVKAWEFEVNAQIQAAAVHNLTEIRFYQGITSVQTNLPLPRQNDVYYWETKIYEMPRGETLSVGLTTKPYPLFRLPGYHKYSVAYDSTGHKRLNQPFRAKPYGRPWMQGDVIGVGYRTSSGTVFFTHNGKKLDDVVQGLKVNLFPTVGSTGGGQVMVNLGQVGFVYIEGNVKKWGLAPVHGTLAPPPAYGDQNDSVLLELQSAPTPSQLPPAFEELSEEGDLEGAIGMARLPPPYPPGHPRSSDSDASNSRPIPGPETRRSSSSGHNLSTPRSTRGSVIRALQEAQQDS